MDARGSIEIRHALRWMYVGFSGVFLAIAVLSGFVRLGFAFFWGAWFLLCTTAAVHCLTKRWRLDAEGLTQTGLFFCSIPWSEVQRICIERSSDFPWYCKIAIRTSAGRTFKMDSPHLAPASPDSVAHLIEFVEEQVAPGVLEVKEKAELKKELKKWVLSVVLAPLIAAAADAASPVVRPIFHDHVWRPLLDFVVRLFH